MIRLFGTTDKTYQSNGDLVIRALKAKVHKEDNLEFYRTKQCTAFLERRIYAKSI